MLNRIWTYLKAQVVADIPNAIAACVDCDVSMCSGNKLGTCERRLAGSAALDAWDRDHAPQTRTVPLSDGERAREHAPARGGSVHLVSAVRP